MPESIGLAVVFSLSVDFYHLHWPEPDKDLPLESYFHLSTYCATMHIPSHGSHIINISGDEIHPKFVGWISQHITTIDHSLLLWDAKCTSRNRRVCAHVSICNLDQRTSASLSIIWINGIIIIHNIVRYCIYWIYIYIFILNIIILCSFVLYVSNSEYHWLPLDPTTPRGHPRR